MGSVNRNAKPERLRASYGERWGDRWYLVNAKGGTIGDIPVYEHVTDIPAEITLAVVNVGTRLVAKTVEECGKHGVPYVLIFTAGFSEVGEAGAALEREVGEVARRYGIRVFGPNTNTNAFEVLPEPPTRRGGRIGLVTQSGHQGRPLVQGTEFGVAFSRWVPDGQRARPRGRRLHRVLRLRRRHRRHRRLLRGLQGPRQAPARPRGRQRPGQAGGGAQDGEHRGGDAHGELAHRAPGRFRRRGRRACSRSTGWCGCATSTSSSRRPRSSPSCPPAPGAGAVSTPSRGVGHAHGRGRRVERRARSGAVGAAPRRALREMIPDYLTVANPVDNGAQFLVSAPVEDRKRVFDLIAADPERRRHRDRPHRSAGPAHGPVRRGHRGLHRRACRSPSW